MNIRAVSTPALSIEVPPTASDHPVAGKFDFPLYHPPSRAAWRSWLQAHHTDQRGAWVVSWRRPAGQEAVGDGEAVAYEDLVLESLCFGWIDSTTKVFDADRRMIMMTPRKPRSGWTRLNRRRVAELERQGLMTEAGHRAIEVAKSNGWWSLMDSVEDLQEPENLAKALDAVPSARAKWDATPPSTRKQSLWWLITAAKPETKARRIETIVADASR